MENQYIYLEKLQGDIESLNIKMTQLVDKIKLAEGQARAEYKQEFTALHQRRNELREKLETLRHADNYRQESFREGVERALNDLRRAWDNLKKGLW